MNYGHATQLRQVLFDPLQLSSDESVFKTARCLELAIGRLAMLAAVGIPAAELYHESLAGVAGWPSLLAPLGKAPSMLNGGESVPVAEFFALIGLTGLIWNVTKDEGDSEKVADEDPINPTWMSALPLSPLLLFVLRSAQTTNGRVAMVAVMGLAAQEAVTGKAVVDVSPFLFGLA